MCEERESRALLSVTGKKSHWGDCQSKGGTKMGLQTSSTLVANKRRDFVSNTDYY